MKTSASGVSRAAFAISWADALWLPEDEKIRIRAATPLHLRATVETGLPMLGAGSIYPIPIEEVLVDSFPIPAHYKRLYGFDVGWKRTAAVFIAVDPDTDTAYVFGEHYVAEQVPEVHAASIKRIAGSWMLGAIDPASHGKSQQDGAQLIKTYRQLGLRLREADNAIESGIHAVWSRLAAGKLKFFKETTPNTQREFILYRRKDNGGGTIVKKDDHAMDALRYGVMSLHMAGYPNDTLFNSLETKHIKLPSGGKRYNV